MQRAALLEISSVTHTTQFMHIRVSKLHEFKSLVNAIFKAVHATSVKF